MDIYKVKFTALQQEIFRMLCVKAGLQISQRQIAKLLNVSPTAISNSLPLLQKEGIVRITKSTPKFHLIELNRESQLTLDYKRAENLRILFESGLPKYLEDTFNGCTIAVFGSYAKGDDIHTSDIDIAIIGSKPKSLGIDRYEKLLEKPIRINFYPNLSKIEDKYLRSNICNGIVLAGAFEL